MCQSWPLAQRASDAPRGSRRIAGLRGNFDHVVYDADTLDEPSTRMLARAVDEVLLVESALAQATDIADVAARHSLDPDSIRGIVLTQAPAPARPASADKRRAA